MARKERWVTAGERLEEEARRAQRENDGPAHTAHGELTKKIAETLPVDAYMTKARREHRGFKELL